MKKDTSSVHQDLQRVEVLSAIAKILQRENDVQLTTDRDGKIKITELSKKTYRV